MSGEILLQFSLVDSSNLAAAPSDTYKKFKDLVFTSDEEDEPAQIPPPDLDDADPDEETSDELEDPTQPEVVEKRRKRLRLRRLKRRSLAVRAYQFSGAGNGVQGIVFMEIVKITDLPPERNGMPRRNQIGREHALTQSSNAYLLRHGPVCGDLPRKKDAQNSRGPPQSEPRV